MNKFKFILQVIMINLFSSLLATGKELFIYQVCPGGVPTEFGSSLVRSPEIRQAVNTGNLELLKELVAKGANVKEYQGANYGESLLHCAAANLQLEVIPYLVTILGMDPNIKDSSDATPAHYAAGCSFNVFRCNDKTMTQQRFVAKKIAVLTLLKELGANMNAKDKNRSSVLDDAKEEGMPQEIIHALEGLGCH